MDIVVVFTINNKFATPTYIAIKSLLEHAKETTKYKCIIISDDLSDINKKMINSLTKNTAHIIKYLKVDNDLIYAPKETNLWPRVVYYRLYLCEILKDYKKVIYSDVDVFFKDDLSLAWSIEMENYEVAAVAAEKNDKNVIVHQYYEENKKEYIYWDGFMIMNLELMRKNHWFQRCMDNLEKYQNKIKMFDLEIINLTAECIKRLPLRYVLLQTIYDFENIEKSEDFLFLKKIYTKEDMLNEKKNTIIIHYAGGEGKPWIRKKIPKYYNAYIKELPTVLKIQNTCWRVEDWLRKEVGYLVNWFKGKRN